MRCAILAAGLASLSIGAASAAAAQEATAPAPAETAAPVQGSAGPVAAAGTQVIIEIAEPISSKVHKVGDTFAIRLASPIVVGSTVVAPAGATGKGQVIDAASAGALGRPAKLVLAARFVEVNGARVPLRAFHLGSAGKDNTNTIMAASFVPYVGVFAGFMKGGEIIIPAGALGQAKLGADLPAAPAPPPTPAPPTVAPAQPAAAPASPVSQ